MAIMIGYNDWVYEEPETDPELIVDGVQMYIYKYDPLLVNHTGTFFWDYKRWPHVECEKIPIEEFNKNMKEWYPGRIDWLKGPEKSPHYCKRCGSHFVSLVKNDKLECVECWNNFKRGEEVNWVEVDDERHEYAQKHCL